MMKNIFGSKKTKKISIHGLLFQCVWYRILNPAEAETALRTGLLPDDILQRLKIADLKSKN
jgi:hypothetical protein